MNADFAAGLRFRRMTGRTVRNWAGNEACVPTSLERPGSCDEVAAIVAAAHARRQRVKVIGAGHSFTPAAMTSGVLLSLERMARVRHVDRGRGRVTVEAGITLRALADELEAVGLAMPNLGDINVQSVAGAISTATHGTGRELGNLATTIVGIELVDGAGQVVWCDDTNEPDLWRSARVGVGALGVVTAVTIQCVPAFNLHAHETIEPLDDLLADLDGFASSADHAEFFWMPGSRALPGQAQPAHRRATTSTLEAGVRARQVPRREPRFRPGVPGRAALPVDGAVDRQARCRCGRRARPDRSQ